MARESVRVAVGNSNINVCLLLKIFQGLCLTPPKEKNVSYIFHIESRENVSNYLLTNVVVRKEADESVYQVISNGEWAK